jgi:hypothetical protein
MTCSFGFVYVLFTFSPCLALWVGTLSQASASTRGWDVCRISEVWVRGIYLVGLFGSLIEVDWTVFFGPV